MLDIKFIREHPDLVKKAAHNKGYEVDVEYVLEIDKKHRELLLGVQRLREKRNKQSLLFGKPKSRLSKEKNIEEGKKLKEKLEKEENALRAAKEEVSEWLFKIPNLPASDVAIGKDESKNEVIKTVGKPQKFSFPPKDHLELGELLDIIDVKRAAKVSGTRFAYLKNEGALLEFALVQLTLDILIKEGFIPIVPPVLIRKDIMRGLGYMEHGADEDIFSIGKDGLMLVGTAEHPIVAMHKDEVFDEKDLPRRYVGFSTAFRREAGSYGKDTRGILRVHQFDKVEMVSFVAEEEDDKEHEYLLSLQEKLWKMLGIPYQVIKMCTGDLGFPTARKYDIEAWMPAQNKYREVTSVSTTTDFQARRLNIGLKDSGFVHILNGTVFAIGRTLVAILENYQQKDGSILIPKALQKYTNFAKISLKKV